MKRLAGLAVAACWAGPACAAPMTGTASLACGGAELRATTVHDAHLPPDDAFGYLSQTILLRPATSAPEKPLHPISVRKMRLPGGQKVLSAIVQSWACLPGKSGVHYILLDVACQRDDAGRACGGQAERFVLFSLAGTQLDSGTSPQAKSSTALYERLGVSVDSVPMLDATGP